MLANVDQIRPQGEYEDQNDEEISTNNDLFKLILMSETPEDE